MDFKKYILVGGVLMLLSMWKKRADKMLSDLGLNYGDKVTNGNLKGVLVKVNHSPKIRLNKPHNGINMINFSKDFKKE